MGAAESVLRRGMRLLSDDAWKAQRESLPAGLATASACQVGEFAKQPGSASAICLGGRATPDVFISYARGDAARARQFAEALEQQGLDVWWDDALRAGDVFDEAIEQALRAARAVVVLWSPRSVASRWVRAEATIADRNATLIPCMIESCERPVIFELTHTADLRHWDGDADDGAWREYLGDIRKLVTGEIVPRSATSGKSTMPLVARREKPRVALVPLESRPEDADLAKELAEEVIRGFARYAYALTVIDQPDEAQFRIESRLSDPDGKLRLTVRLVDTRTGMQAMGERFTSDCSDRFAAQEELAAKLVAHVAQAVENSESTWAIEQSPDRLGAYHRLLVGLHCVREFSPQGLRKARQILEDALDETPLDPYLLSLASLACSVLLIFRGVDDREATAAAAREFMRKALIAGRDDPQVLGWSAIGGLYSGADLTMLDNLIDRALERNPGWSYLWHFNSSVKLLKGDPQAALERVERAFQLDPWSVDRWAMLSNRGSALFFLGRFEEALAPSIECDSLVPISINSLTLAAVLLRLGRADEAREVFRRLPENLEIEIGYFRSPECRAALREVVAELEA